MESNREGDIRKGPWKSEEDEVLINHVSKYGPRDWSSIRSKGLLRRTGKSCRLRWVNKLRPNLKNGCKFSLEEERVVIELQAEFGNKWARIATYLSGRTDNDVKNFWSSRQKRLARILHTSQTSSSSTPHNNNNKRQLLPVVHDVPILEGGVALSSSSEGESMPKILSCSSSTNNESSDLFKPKLISFEHDLYQPQAAVEMEKKNDDSSAAAPALLHVPFPPQPELLPFPEESHEILGGLDPYYDVFGNGPEFQLGAPFLGTHFDDAANPDAFFDDFPIDMFDQIEPLPSPSHI